ncbi:MAG: arsenite methyltransferase [Sphingobacteriaceae bacterium]|nr:arsenite methyltransferase [Cytophagaceae bacterium]
MKTAEENLKTLVRESYTRVAEQGFTQNAGSCCGSGPSLSTVDSALMAENYDALGGYVPEADLGLGCGLPTQFAHIRPGDVVIDLGSGAGNDAFVARHETGPTGKVIGVDFTPAMLEKARRNAEVRGFNNVEFRLGDIDSMPVSDNVADVVVSNCVLNLVPDKPAVFREMHRVLKPGGHFSVSDIVLVGELPEGIKGAAELYAGCVSGAIDQADYLGGLREAGFQNLTVQKAKPILLPDEILSTFLSETDLAAFRASGAGVVSVTVYGEKTGEKRPNSAKTEAKAACCGVDSTCC